MATKKTAKKPAKKAAAKKAAAKKPITAARAPADAVSAPVPPPPPPPPPGPEVGAKCRRGSDQFTAGQSCGSLRAFRITPEGSSSVSLRCAKCGFAWVTPIGGTFNMV